MINYTLERTAAADPATVFDVLTDHVGYARISAPRKVELEREGTPAPNGVGAIRALYAVGPPIREEVTLYEAPARFGYRVLSGLPAREQSGEVTLSPSGTGTHIAYSLAIDPAYGPVGAVAARVTRAVVGKLLGDIVKEAEKRSAAQAAA